MDQRTRNQQVVGKGFCFFIADRFRTGTVMAEDDMPQLAGQGALMQEEGQALIISNKAPSPKNR